MEKQIIIASHNENKIKEFKSLFKNSGWHVLSLKDLNYDADIIEDGITFQDNALIKAKTIFKHTNIPTIADDSGLAVNALHGFPGTHSARFMQNEPYSLKNKKIIEMLADYSDKSAKFICAIALVGLDRFPQVFVGEVKGIIVPPVEGEHGFGYDPIFYYANAQKTFAEMSIEEKDAVSHRGIATERLLAYLQEFHF